MLDALANLMENVSIAIQSNITFLLSWLGLLWGINIVNAATHYRLNVLGVYPRRLHGLLGIIFSPFLSSNKLYNIIVVYHSFFICK